MTGLNVAAIIQSKENSTDKKYRTNLCSEQTVYFPHSKGHISSVKRGLKATITKLAMPRWCNVTFDKRLIIRHKNSDSI